MILRRTVETVYGSNEILFHDEIENQGFKPEPLCFLYHCNAGYPFLTPESRLILPEVSCIPRDGEAQKEWPAGFPWDRRRTDRRSRCSSTVWRRIVKAIHSEHL